jgi:hypothetical protein
VCIVHRLLVVLADLQRLRDLCFDDARRATAARTAVQLYCAATVLSPTGRVHTQLASLVAPVSPHLCVYFLCRAIAAVEPLASVETSPPSSTTDSSSAARRQLLLALQRVGDEWRRSGVLELAPAGVTPIWRMRPDPLPAATAVPTSGTGGGAAASSGTSAVSTVGVSAAVAGEKGVQDLAALLQQVPAPRSGMMCKVVPTSTHPSVRALNRCIGIMVTRCGELALQCRVA